VQVFEYVFVLMSIIIGLALTHLLQGLANIVQHPGRDRIWWVHLLWVAWAFFFSIFWWWWQFRYYTIETWTLPLYLFVVGYAFLVYLIAAMLFPKDLVGYDGFKDYFLSRHRWFFSLLITACLFDFVDSWQKGADYLASLGVNYFAYLATIIVLGIAGMLTRNERAHAFIALVLLGYQVYWAFLSFLTVE